MAAPSPLQPAAGSSPAPSVRLLVKVVPGSRRTRLAGVLGDRLKIQVSAPPEDGKANAMVCALLAEVFNLPSRQITVTDGQTRPRKTITLAGIDLPQAQTRLQPWLTDP